jgi:L-amino acid N-acyltransferase YncA
MLIRNCLPADVEHEAVVYNAAAARLPGFRPVTTEQIRRTVSSRTHEASSRICAEVDGRLVGYVSYEPTGRVNYPWCLPGHEMLAHQLFTTVLRTLADRKVSRAFAACRGDWENQVEFFKDHGFAKVRDVVNFTQSIADLPTMFQRPGLNITLIKPEDVPEIERLVPGFLRLTGPALADHFLNNPAFPRDATYVLRRKEGVLQGVGVLIDDASFASVDSLDPRTPTYWSGSFGAEGLPSKRVNGMFSFLAAPGKDAVLIGQDLLWYGTSRMETNTFEFLAAQVPNDIPHLLSFYDRYFEKQGSFPVFERDIGSLSAY